MSRTDEFESQDDDDDAVDSPEVVTQDIERGARFGSSLAGASLTQLLLVLGADPAVAAIAGAGTTPVVANAFDAIVRRRRERLVIASTEACRQGNCTFDDIIAAAIDSDRKIEMLASALNAAAASDDERKVRALGIALANGVLQTDQARIDESAVILRTIARLDAPDVRLLHHMAESTQTGFVVRTSRSVDQGTLVSNLPHLAPVIDALVAKLSGLGIITDESFGISSNTVWHVTSLGRQCLAAIAAHGAQPE